MFNGYSDTDKTSDSIRPTSSSVFGLFLNLVVNCQMLKEKEKRQKPYLIISHIHHSQRNMAQNIPFNDQIKSTKILNSRLDNIERQFLSAIFILTTNINGPTQ